MSDLKAITRQFKTDLQLHKALLQRSGANKTEAEVVAYAEGREGLEARLNPKKENPQ